MLNVKNKNQNFFMFVLLLVLTSLAACMPKAQNEEGLGQVQVKASNLQSAASNATVRLTGSCPPGVRSVLVDVNGNGYKTALALSALALGSGLPAANCDSRGQFTMDYPVPNPSVAATINFAIKVKDGTGRVSLVTRFAYNYIPALGGKPGFAIVSAGDTQTGPSGTHMTSSLGELAGSTYSAGSAGTKLKGGLVGTVNQ